MQFRPAMPWRDRCNVQPQMNRINIALVSLLGLQLPAIAHAADIRSAAAADLAWARSGNSFYDRQIPVDPCSSVGSAMLLQRLQILMVDESSLHEFWTAEHDRSQELLGRADRWAEVPLIGGAAAF